MEAGCIRKFVLFSGPEAYMYIYIYIYTVCMYIYIYIYIYIYTRLASAVQVTADRQQADLLRNRPPHISTWMGFDDAFVYVYNTYIYI